ncbi:DUF397 domain-containing protein [Kitasatospora sp. NBC_01560]|uniref:DUF397 domain-containing protein n=1 Tax=Kitasatospora sp. NBC_01560 TaxID=2975965 RepID=UPI00386E7660
MGSPIWQKSSYSGSSNACIEIRTAGGLIELRESDDADTILRTTPVKLAALLHAIKAGDYDRHASPA